jgi:protocatechuate 3,4-dioxygenase beta subunit
MPKKKTATEGLPLTAAVEEGPYYTQGSPERKNIADPGTPGTKLIVEGRVLNRSGQPVAHAWLDFWQADGRGDYDNAGYMLRGYQYTDKEGRYHLETVRPSGYQSRAAHVHVKVRASEKSPVFTTQLFFPGDSKSTTDPLFEKLTIMDIEDIAGGQKARFDFVIATQ